MTDLTKISVQVALKKMVSQGYFDICTIDGILKLTGSLPHSETYNQLRLIHCVHYKEMPNELLEAIPDMISRCVNSPKFDFTIEIGETSHAEPVAIPKRNWLQNLLP